MDASFAVVEAVINFFHCWPIENALRILESDPMPDEIAAIFLSVPTVAHIVYLHNVNISRSCAWCAPFRSRQRRSEPILLFNSSAGTDDHTDLPSSPKKVISAGQAIVSTADRASQPRAVENQLKKRLDTCSSVIVNYNSDWQR